MRCPTIHTPTPLLCVFYLYFTLALFPASARSQGNDEKENQLQPGSKLEKDAALPPRIVCGEVLDPDFSEEILEAPPITPAMQKMADKFPDLQFEIQKNNFCIGDGKDCNAKDTERGGEEIVTAMESNQFQSDAYKQQFHQSVTQEGYVETRDSAALAIQKGFARRVRSFRLLYRLFDHEKFFDNSEGVYLSMKKTLDVEKEEQGKLAGILLDIENELARNAKDQQSLDSITFYRERAERNEKSLGLISCEAGRMAKQNRENEDRLVSIMDEIDLRANKSAGPSADGKDPFQSDISSNGSSGRRPTSERDEILFPYTAYEMGAQVLMFDPPSSNWLGDEEENLFKRVHDKHKQKEAHGWFIQGMLD